ncbi:MAG: PLP-dependent aminotransferase family protein [Firmicutes bacterium]|nr:PLP-dependent aminotransferase family protein [Bacillota bacterium]
MKPIVMDLNNNNTEFLYIQLYEELKSQILSGHMSCGERLPSLRNLSSELGISVTTIGQAYDQLLVEGYIMSKPQSGYYVASINSQSSSLSGQTMQPADNLIHYAFEEPPYLYDLNCFDFRKWKKCAAKVFNHYSQLLLFESDPQGEPALRYEISKYIHRFRGVNAHPDNIVIGAGTQQITSHLSRILAKMDIHHVSLEAPGYLPVQSMFCDGGFTVSHIHVASDGIDIERLPVNISSAVYVSPSNQFPTGAVMPVGRRYQLLEWAKNNNSIIIEDDYDSELRYFGKPVPAMQGLDKNNRVVYLGSFSSTLFPAVKISYMVLPDAMAAIFRSIKNQYTQTCSKSEQLTLALFMEEGHYYTGIRKLRSLYSQKLQAAVAAFAKYGGSTIVSVNTQSGINLTIKVRSHKSADSLCTDAASLGLHMVPLSEITDQQTSALIFYYNQIPLDQIDSLIQAVTSTWNMA